MARHEHRKQKNLETPFKTTCQVLSEKQRIDNEVLKTREWVKNNLPPSKYSKEWRHPLNGLTKEEYMKICYPD
jgi:hypothetical protein